MIFCRLRADWGGVQNLTAGEFREECWRFQESDFLFLRHGGCLDDHLGVFDNRRRFDAECDGMCDTATGAEAAQHEADWQASHQTHSP